MKFYRNLCLVAVCSLLVSCFKEEPLNAECDILAVRIADNQLQEMFFNEAERQIDVLSGDSIINFKVSRFESDCSPIQDNRRGNHTTCKRKHTRL